VLFSKDDIEEALRVLVEELVAAGVAISIQVVGSAAIALQVDREALTDDIDALYRPTPEFNVIVKRLAAERDWPETWLNDAVKMFASHYDTSVDWKLKTDDNGVMVFVARPELLLAMKLLAGRGRRDATDIDLLLKASGVTSLESAVEIFDRYYPAEVMSKKAMAQLKERFESDT